VTNSMVFHDGGRGRLPVPFTTSGPTLRDDSWLNPKKDGPMDAGLRTPEIRQTRSGWGLVYGPRRKTHASGRSVHTSPFTSPGGTVLPDRGTDLPVVQRPALGERPDSRSKSVTFGGRHDRAKKLASEATTAAGPRIKPVLAARRTTARRSAPTRGTHLVRRGSLRGSPFPGYDRTGFGQAGPSFAKTLECGGAVFRAGPRLLARRRFKLAMNDARPATRPVSRSSICPPAFSPACASYGSCR